MPSPAGRACRSPTCLPRAARLPAGAPHSVAGTFRCRTSLPVVDQASRAGCQTDRAGATRSSASSSPAPRPTPFDRAFASRASAPGCCRSWVTLMSPHAMPSRSTSSCAVAGLGFLVVRRIILPTPRRLSFWLEAERVFRHHPSKLEIRLIDGASQATSFLRSSPSRALVRLPPVLVIYGWNGSSSRTFHQQGCHVRGAGGLRFFVTLLSTMVFSRPDRSRRIPVVICSCPAEVIWSPPTAGASGLSFHNQGG